MFLYLNWVYTDIVGKNIWYLKPTRQAALINSTWKTCLNSIKITGLWYLPVFQNTKFSNMKRLNLTIRSSVKLLFRAKAGTTKMPSTSDFFDSTKNSARPLFWDISGLKLSQLMYSIKLGTMNLRPPIISQVPRPMSTPLFSSGEERMFRKPVKNFLLLFTPHGAGFGSSAPLGPRWSDNAQQGSSVHKPAPFKFQHPAGLK